MIYAKVDAADTVLEFPIQEQQLRQKLLGVSLPEDIKDADLEGTGFVIIDLFSSEEIPKPTLTHEVRMIKPVKTELGWERRFVSVECLPKEKNEARIAKLWRGILKTRDAVLSSTDYRVLRAFSETALGLPPSEDPVVLETYRQALRDISKQEDPYNIVFPPTPFTKK